MILSEEKKAKINEILSSNGYTNIRFEENVVIAINPNGLETVMTNKEVLMLFAFVKG